MSTPSMSGVLEINQIVWFDGDFLRKTQVNPTDYQVIIVGEGRHDDYYYRYNHENINVIYFQGLGLALTEDYAGGWMTRDADGNGVGDPAQLPYKVVVREGAQCDPKEYARFMENQ